MTGRQPELRWAHLTPLLPGPLAPSGLARHPLPVDVLAQFQLGCVQSRRRPAPRCHQHLLLLGGLCAHRRGAVQRPAQEGQAGHGEQWRGSGDCGERCGYDPPPRRHALPTPLRGRQRQGPCTRLADETEAQAETTRPDGSQQSPGPDSWRCYYAGCWVPSLFASPQAGGLTAVPG